MERHNIKRVYANENTNSMLNDERPFCSQCGEIKVKVGRKYCNTCLDNQRKIYSEVGGGLFTLFLALSIALYYWLIPPLTRPGRFLFQRVFQHIDQLFSPDFSSAPIYILFGCIVLSVFLAAYLSKIIYDKTY